MTMRITGRTKVAALFGYPVEHTLSPVMQNAAFDHLGLDCCYLPFPVHPDSLKQAVESIRALSLLGANLTTPHKETVIPFLDALDAEAAAISAVNTIVNHDGKLTGFNTDGKGFMRSLKELGVDPADRKVLIIGAGGSSRAIGYYLSRGTGGLTLYNRSRDKAEALAADLASAGGKVTVAADLRDLGGFDIIVNATSLGLQECDAMPLDPDALEPTIVVCDLIYHKTPLLSRAEAKGCKTVGGIGMLLWQGALAFELWTGKIPPVEIMRSALLSHSA
ncbi:MAG: shikimate dehydrogenase [Nitrospirae bacterium]|nr:shikimate dehydrogenase [Nitrospirota bacterium]